MTSSARSRGSRARAGLRLAVITGEAGTGKSRLAREFAGLAAAGVVGEHGDDHAHRGRPADMPDGGRWR